MLTSHGRFPIQFHLNAGQQHAPLYGVPRARQDPPPPPTTTTLLTLQPLPLLPLPCRLSNCNLATEEGAWVAVCVHAEVVVGLDWQLTGFCCHNIRCLVSLCVQRAAARITVEWDDINYPNPDSSLWNSASTHLSQERTWMVRQSECQRKEMKADKFSGEYSNKNTTQRKVDLMLCLSSLFSWFHGRLIVPLIPIFHPHLIIEISIFAFMNISICQEGQASIKIFLF